MFGKLRPLVLLGLAASLGACFEEPDGVTSATNNASSNASTTTLDDPSTSSSSGGSSGTSAGSSSSSTGSIDSGAETFVETDSATTTDPPQPSACGCHKGAQFCDDFEGAFSDGVAEQWTRPVNSGAHTPVSSACGRTALRLSIPPSKEAGDVFTVASRRFPTFNDLETTGITLGGLMWIDNGCFEDTPRIVQLRIDDDANGNFRYGAALHIGDEALELRHVLAQSATTPPPPPLFAEFDSPGSWLSFSIAIEGLHLPPGMGSVTLNVNGEETTGPTPNIPFLPDSTANPVLGPARTVVNKPIACAIEFDDVFVELTP